MKTGLRIAAAAAIFAACALADSWTGTVVDVMCKGKDLASHTRQCAIGCARSGYGLVLPDGKFLKFDEKGNAKTLAVLKASTKDKDLKAKVTGTMTGEVIKVESIVLE